ncbi:MAG: peptidylprolyl isomerase [Bacteroidota bacterium]|nr:peptidylprolyl isomerase [Bacteroidota bacterium]MDP4248885.1 peptidylprolyl isomerase [Bacteroidota bacterium]
MSIIQQIRDKAAWLVFGLIGVSLIGFLLMDSSVGNSRLAASSGSVGSVNGEEFDYSNFEKQISEREDQYKSQGYPVNDMMQQNIREEVWKQFKEDAVLKAEYQKLGLDVSDKELNDMLVGPNALPEIKRAFTDPNTGVFDPQQAAARINQLRTIYKGNRKTDQNYAMAQNFFEQALPQFVKMRLKDKYLSILAKSSYIPKWMVEKANADNSLVSSISYVNVPYQTIPDSLIRISDGEIESYLDKHLDQYQQEDSRSVRYVVFNAAPTAADSNALKQQVTNLKQEFSTTADVEGFLARNGTEINYHDGYTPKSRLTGARKDSLSMLPKGSVIGPYLDGPNYVIARIMDIKTLPDSARARHILVATVNLKTNQPTLDDSTAKKKIDSIKNLIDKGARFDSVAYHLSDDEGTRIKGGDLGYFAPGQMVKEFGDFVFSGKVGERKIVKTQFGYHYIEIEDQKNFEPAYKIAYFARKIEPSTETDDNASGLASQFAGESRSQAAFDENVKKANLQKIPAQDIHPTDFTIPGLGSSRSLVRWIFDAKLGEVSESFSVGDKYVVAILTEINKKGDMTEAKARPIIEPILRNQKKAEQISQKIASATSLEAVAAATGRTVAKADSLLFSSPYIPNVGPEPKVVGYAFDKQLVGKAVSQPVGGNEGVFVLKIREVGAKASYNGDIEQIRQSMLQTQESIIQRAAVDALEKTAKVKDNRAKFL